ncbi:MAG: dihydrodipicolinate synthase family protein [Planctomycetota bacterium]
MSVIAVDPVLEQLQAGVVIPAHPLALSADRRFDERRQRALTRYYAEAGAGGIAVGVHTTQFAIREPAYELLRPVLQCAADEMDRADAQRSTPLIRVAGVCGNTAQAVGEAALARDLGYRFGLVSLGGLAPGSIDAMIAHCREVGEVIELFGFYLQPDVGGVELPIAFWRKFCEIDRARAIKAAPFDRYRTLQVVRAVAESGRDDLALYTGNDDNIVADLVTPYQFEIAGQQVERRFVGGLLGHWAVDTAAAVRLLTDCHAAVAAGRIPVQLLWTHVELTDMNAALFDAANSFRGCIAGINETLRRQGLLASGACLQAADRLSDGQLSEIDRVRAAYPHLTDDALVARRREEWLADS